MSMNKIMRMTNRGIMYDRYLVYLVMGIAIASSSTMNTTFIMILTHIDIKLIIVITGVETMMTDALLVVVVAS